MQKRLSWISRDHLHRFRYPLFFFILIGLGFGCSQPADYTSWDDHYQYQQGRWNRDLTGIIIKDIFTPPVASRIYAYANIAAYEAMHVSDPSFQSLGGQVNALNKLPASHDPSSVYAPIAGVVAFMRVSQELVFSPKDIQALEEGYLQEAEELGIPKRILQASTSWGQQVADHIIAWANRDGYHQRQALPSHDYSEDPDAWTPTPPTYMQGIEPHWNTLRTFVLDSATQFKPLPPTDFSSNPSSPFYQEAFEVYQTVLDAGEEEKEIAKFWDCNPNIAYFKGHVMMFHQKISPGGHWISIIDIASRVEQLSMMEEAEAYAVTSIALADAFISCWDEKYRSNLVRPETYIERYIDSTWFPLLETPAFPEYTSGHSVISSAAATALTHLMGDEVAFLDSTEVQFGLPARSYSSFTEAAEEAAISRLYGGIHYRPAIENGVDQGKQLGNWVLQHIETRADE